MAKLSIYVYVIGLGNSFRVDILSSKDVSDLKEAILSKRPNALKDIDAAELVLYKVQEALKNLRHHPSRRGGQYPRGGSSHQ